MRPSSQLQAQHVHGVSWFDKKNQCDESAIFNFHMKCSFPHFEIDLSCCLSSASFNNNWRLSFSLLISQAARFSCKNKLKHSWQCRPEMKNYRRTLKAYLHGTPPFPSRTDEDFQVACLVLWPPFPDWDHVVVFPVEPYSYKKHVGRLLRRKF